MSSTMKKGVFLMKGFFFQSKSGISSVALPELPASLAVVDMQRLSLMTETTQDRQEVIGMFCRLAEEQVSDMQRSRRNEESSGWKAAAHHLKGAAANLGMNRVAERCRQAENAQSLSYENADALLQEIHMELQRVKEYLVQL
jgi:HPt (histidine-containing phosphotransfer) domain-containing protein